MGGGVPPQAIRARSPGRQQQQFGPSAFVLNGLEDHLQTRSLKAIQIGLELPGFTIPQDWLGSIKGQATPGNSLADVSETAVE